MTSLSLAGEGWLARGRKLCCRVVTKFPAASTLIIGHCRLPRNYRRELPLLPDSRESGPRNSSAPPITVQGQGGGKAEERARPVDRGARPGKELVGAGQTPL